VAKVALKFTRRKITLSVVMRLMLLGLFAAVAISSLARGAATSPIGALDAGLYPEMVALLAKADQDRVWAAYHKALADNPDLKKEGNRKIRRSARCWRKLTRMFPR
jgi:hypothetical protein